RGRSVQGPGRRLAAGIRRDVCTLKRDVCTLKIVSLRPPVCGREGACFRSIIIPRWRSRWAIFSRQVELHGDQGPESPARICSRRVMKTINASLWGLLLCMCLTACGVNPVTGKQELQFVSEASDLKIGEEHYAPTRQGEGGDFSLDPDLTAYVSEVGQKLAVVSDRKLPYEFVVLNSSVPNAWALPGGKIAVN